ncbi:hypothetical protein ABPG72_007827 [Tetrahymena utriculariae]
MTLYSDFLSISFGNTVNLTINSLTPQNQALLNAYGYINFNFTLQINIENILFMFTSDSNNQCGLQFNQIQKQMLVNNVNQISSTNSTTCYSIIVNNSTVILSNIIINDHNFSDFQNSIIQIKSSQSSYNNIYLPQLSSKSDIKVLTTFLFQINKLQSIQISNIVVQNQFELAFSIISYSQYVTLYNISCQNNQDFIQDQIFTATYAGCFQFNDINSLDLDKFNSSNIVAIDNSILSIINQNQQKSRINLSNITVFNSFFKQTIANTQANPVFISSVYKSNVTIQVSQFYNNTLNGLANSETYSTTGIQITNIQGDVTLQDSQFQNSKSDSAYNFLYIQSNSSLITNSTFAKSSFNLNDSTTLFQQQGGCIRIKTNNLILNNSSFSSSTSAIGPFLFIEPLSKLLAVNISKCSFDQGYSNTN